MEINFGRKVTETPNTDGSSTIRTEGYYKGSIKSVREETRMDIDTTRNTLLKDIITCLDQLKTDTPDVTIKIIKDKYGEPFLIQKTWVVYKEKN